MIKYYYRSLRSEALVESAEYKRGAWVYVEAPTQREVIKLVEKFNLEQSIIEDALDEDEMPRLEKDGENSYIFVRFVMKNGEGELITMPLLFVFGPELLMTVSLVRLPALEMFEKGKIEFATTQRTKLVLQILQQIGEQYDSYITATSKQVKLIRNHLKGHAIGNQDFVDFVTIEDHLNEFLSSLAPTNATLRRLVLGRYIPLFEEDQDIVEDLLLNNEQSIEACNSNMKSISNIREAYTSISANNLNRTIKLLTMVTVLIMLPSMIYGMYGMNVPLPFQKAPWAFAGIIVFTTLFNVVFVVFARRNRIL